MSVILGLLVLVLLVVIGIVFRNKLQPQAAIDHPTYLISYGISNYAFPDYLAKNLKTIEQNYPYDGVGIQTNFQSKIMRSTSISASTMKSELQPLFDVVATTKPTKLNHSLLQVLLHSPGNAFDDAGWNTAIQNFATTAQVLKELKTAGFGVDGILFDNEGPYSPEPGGFWDYYKCYKWDNTLGAIEITCNYTNTSHTLAEYQAKMVQRGKQVMTAMKANFPEIKFVFMHSSDISCTNNDLYYVNELIGSFSVGLAEGSDSLARAVDGSEESYAYTQESQFINRYNFLKSTLPTVQPACSFIPSADRTNWSQIYDVGHGLYNKQQTSSTIGNAAKYALMHSDSFVWFYVEGVTTIGNTSGGYPQIGQDWTNALAGARAAVPNPTGSPSPIPSPSLSPIASPSPSLVPGPSPSPSPSPSPTLCEPTAPGNLTATAVSTSQIDLSWTDSTGENGYLIQQSTDGTNFNQIGNTYAPDVTTWQDKNLSVGTYLYRVQAYNGCGTGLSSYSNIAKATIVSTDTQPLSAIPSAPTNLAASAASSSKINLSWTDSSTNENGFAIERSTSATSGFVQIASIWPNMTTYKDSGLARKTTYYYRIRAFNASGNSAYSNIASARTKTWWVF